MLLSTGLVQFDGVNEFKDVQNSLDDEQSEGMDQTDSRAFTGEQKLLVIAGNFSDMADKNFTNGDLKQFFEIDFDEFYQEVSYGAISIDADVYGWLELPNPRDYYEIDLDCGNDGLCPSDREDMNTWNVGKSKYENLDWNSDSVVDDKDTFVPDSDGTEGDGIADAKDVRALDHLLVCQDLVTALESLAATSGGVIDFSSFDQLVCLVNGEPFRGWAYTNPIWNNAPTLTLSDGTNFKIPATVMTETGDCCNYASPPTPDPVKFWGRVAHEYGHLIGKTHVSEDYNNGYALMAGLYPGHMSAYKKFDGGDCNKGGETQLDWLDESQIYVAEPGVHDKTIRPLELGLDTLAIKIDISPKRFYMVEVRKYIGFDNNTSSSGNKIMVDEGVIIYDVDDSKCGDQVTIIDPDPTTSTHEAWKVGQNHSDTIGGKDFKIEIIEPSFNGYKIRVSYEISGLLPADVSITPWDPPNGEYYTPDIWIDSPINDWDWYRNDGEGSDIPNNKSGDDPLVGHVNRLWFNVTNSGELPAMDVEVKAYWTTPPVTGINTQNLEYIGNVTIDEIAPMSSINQSIDWTPIVADLEENKLFDLHSCIVIEITELDGELSTGDNSAQENVHRFETTSSSPFHPVGVEFMVNNPYGYSTFVHSTVDNLPAGWTYELAWDREYVGPFSETANSITVTPPASLNAFTEIGVPVDFQIVTWIDVKHGAFGDIVMEFLGGNSISIVPVEKVDINFDVVFDGGALNVDGTVNSQSFTSAGDDYSNSIVAIEYTSPDGIAYLHPVSMGHQTDTCHAQFAPGTSIDIVYTSPSGQTSTSSRTMNSNGEYMDSFQMSETGTWTITYTYVDVEQITHSWSTTEEVASRTSVPAPIANGYDKDCRTGTFTDTWGGSMEEESNEDPLIPIPCPVLTNGEWKVRVLYGGDSVHQSKASDYKTILVHGLPNIHADINVGDVFQIEGDLATSVHSASELTIVYISPSGDQYRHTAAISRDSYSDRIILDEEGTWTIKLSYVDVNRDSIEWTETVNVIGFDVGPIGEPEIERPTEEIVVNGTEVDLGGILNTTSDDENTISVGTVVSIRVTSPSGDSFTREAVVDEDKNIDYSVFFNEPGRWTVEYSYTDDNGQVVEWGEAVDVEEEAIEKATPSAYEAGVIFAAALVILTGMILAFVARPNMESIHTGPGQGEPPEEDQPVTHDSVEDLLDTELR